MRRASIHALLILSLTGMAGGCATSRNPFQDEEGTREIKVEVLNLNFSDATVYALRQGQRIRLGRVAGKGREFFTLRWPTSLSLQLEFRLLAAEQCVTENLNTDPGDHIYLEIPVDVRGSSLCRQR
ncbi:MAG: hypothetical protein RQ751_01100 [Longimicrobiales bacterium]|nr:hypothetical protein [Longimicrobiales bacterium]